MDPIIIAFSVLVIFCALAITGIRCVKNPRINTFSIIIACRNEEQNLPHLFHHLNNLDYPNGKFEIILADDASKDSSPQLIREFCEKNKAAKAVFLSEKNVDYKGKKAALKAACDLAEFDYLLFTDADCLPGKLWIQHFNLFIREDTGLVAGHYLGSAKNSFQKFCLQLNAAIFAVSIRLGIPFTAAGGNLCLLKKAFLQVGGYEKIKHNLAGDDKQMLNLIANTNWKISYNYFSDVYTSDDSLSSSQRNRRKFGKWDTSPFSIKVLSLLISAFFIYFPIKMIFVWNSADAIIFLAAISIFWLINIQKHHFRFSMINIFHLLLYPYYVIFYTLWSRFSGWQWKDQHSKEK
jgi:glycosyltransferase involved in cell wall biosynthesis